ncbi:MAG: phosphoglycerate dehydrogenase [Actinomycetota bacterium]|nr:phosphoglycerate dehydrogenase [Actinomycetota bacterium]
MARILVTERLAKGGLEAMSAAGHEVVERLDLTPETLVEAVGGMHALVIRSATRVTEQVLEAGRDLQVVGRAGVGLDNVDVAAATRLGVMVVNAPESNIVSAAEHAIALLLSQARNVPQASAALLAGRWERSRWEGVELHGKTLGIVGLGRIGTLVAQRMHGFGMHLVAYDPYISADRAKLIGVELASLEDLVARADFVTIHLPKTKETEGLFGRELLAKVKPGVRIVNAARGGLVDEQALADAIGDGRVAGAALDVFDSEPCTASPLFALADKVVVTPHLGASTGEAQDKAGEQIAEQIVLALAGDFVPFAVNVSAAGASEAVRPFVGVAEQLGRFLAAMCEGLPDQLEVEYQGALAGEEVGILTLAVLKGIFAASTDEPVSYVNAPQMAKARGLAVREAQTATSPDRVSLVTVRSSAHSVGAALAGPQGRPRFVLVEDHLVEMPPSEHMLVIRNDDRPGRIGAVGTVLGDAGVSIADMAVGQIEGTDRALMVIATTTPVGGEVLARLRSTPGINAVYQVRL